MGGRTDSVAVPQWYEGTRVRVKGGAHSSMTKCEPSVLHSSVEFGILRAISYEW